MLDGRIIMRFDSLSFAHVNQLPLMAISLTLAHTWTFTFLQSPWKLLLWIRLVASSSIPSC